MARQACRACATSRRLRRTRAPREKERKIYRGIRGIRGILSLVLYFLSYRGRPAREHAHVTLLPPATRTLARARADAQHARVRVRVGGVSNPQAGPGQQGRQVPGGWVRPLAQPLQVRAVAQRLQQQLGGGDDTWEQDTKAALPAAFMPARQTGTVRLSSSAAAAAAADRHGRGPLQGSSCK
jgi:hypothetical protein